MMTIILVLDIYEKPRSFKSIHTCILEQLPILLGGRAPHIVSSVTKVWHWSVKLGNMSVAQLSRVQTLSVVLIHQRT